MSNLCYMDLEKKQVINLTQEQNDFIWSFEASELSDIYSSFYKTCESYCDDKEIEYPRYSLAKSKEYWAFFSNLVNQVHENYNEELHLFIIKKILMDKESRKNFFSYFQYSQSEEV